VTHYGFHVKDLFAKQVTDSSASNSFSISWIRIPRLHSPCTLRLCVNHWAAKLRRNKTTKACRRFPFVRSVH